MRSVDSLLLFPRLSLIAANRKQSRSENACRRRYQPQTGDQQQEREQPSAKVLLVQMEAPTNLGRSYTTRFHEAYEKAAQRTGTPLLPFLLDGVAGVARLNQSDGIHPNAEGSKRVAETLWPSLAPVLAELSR